MEYDNKNINKIIKINKKSIILELCNKLNTNEDTFIKNIKAFEKYIKKTIKRKYENDSGLTDIKMNKLDYYILYILYINTNSKEYKLHILLIYIYANSKLDGYDFDSDMFPFSIFFDFLNENQNIHSIFYNLIREM